MPHYDYLIVGSGLFGATFAYKARQAGKTCLVIDKRPHLGGNVYCSPTLIPSPVAEADALSIPLQGGQKGSLIFGGRLAEYKYYDMAPIVEKVLNIVL